MHVDDVVVLKVELDETPLLEKETRVELGELVVLQVQRFEVCQCPERVVADVPQSVV